MRRRFSILMSLLLAGGWEHVHAESADPHIVAAWAAGPFEARIALDRPVAAQVAAALVGRTIAFDESRPTVHARSAPGAPIGALRIAAARLADDGRTLVLTTDPHPRAATYTLVLPTTGPGKPLQVAYDLTGVEAAWTGAGKDAMPLWTLWWPTTDPADVRAQLAGSSGHSAALASLDRKGRLALSTLVTLPRGSAALTVRAPTLLEASLNGEDPAKVDGAAVFRTESTADPMLLSVTVETGRAPGPLSLRVTTRAGSGPESPLSVGQSFLPWTPATPPAPAALENVPDLTGGDPLRGAAVFAGADAKCASCHRVRGEGGTVGPDLSGLVGRDRKDVYRDIAEPSARINPDYVPYTLALKDGRVLVGTVRAEGADAVRVSDTEAKVTVVPRAAIEEFRPGATSVMPVGLAGAIGAEKLRDLIAFLTTAVAK